MNRPKKPVASRAMPPRLGPLANARGSGRDAAGSTGQVAENGSARPRPYRLDGGTMPFMRAYTTIWP